MSKEVESRQPTPLLIMNPVVLNYPKRYILGTTRNSLKLFFRLCNMRVYVDGFVDDELDGVTIYHKRIYKKESITLSDSILLTTDSITEDFMGLAVCNNPVVINPEISGTDIFIYGAGYMGRKLMDYLQKSDTVVRGFIDSDPGKANDDISGIKVYAPDILQSLKKGTSIIEAGKYYKEIDTIISEHNEALNRYYFDDTIALRDEAIWVDCDKSFDGLIFCDGKGDFGNKVIYLCGQDYDLVQKYFELFTILDFENVCIAKWAEELQGVGEPNIRCVEEALLEEDFLILFCESVTEDDFEKLQSLGLERGKDFCDTRCNIWEKEECSPSQVLDVNLGYTRNMQGVFPGIAVFGNNTESDYKIAVLGGSTSSSGFYRFKSWPEILYEICDNDNLTIFNGAVEGYVSSQELIKLMRDIVWLNPDLVIVYDGHNDVARNGAYNIFDIPYMSTIMEYADRNIVKEAKTSGRSIFHGIPPLADVMGVWLKNIEYMHAVCEINHIKFLSFMQPSFFSKAKMISKEDIVTRKKWNCHFSSYIESLDIQLKEFRKAAPMISKSHDYIYDLTHIFDEEDVYMDNCHVYENGNKIIAQEIYKVIKGMIPGN